jgi:hypothetical protein
VKERGRAGRLPLHSPLVLNKEERNLGRMRESIKE